MLNLVAHLVLFEESRLIPAPRFPSSPYIHHSYITSQYKTYIESSQASSKPYSYKSFCNVARRSGAEIENGSQFHLYLYEVQRAQKLHIRTVLKSHHITFQYTIFSPPNQLRGNLIPTDKVVPDSVPDSAMRFFLVQNYFTLCTDWAFLRFTVLCLVLLSENSLHSADYDRVLVPIAYVV